ncbi:hypothetical protein NUM3379_15420 [Kineococcus sp. NUM-3379]
MGSPRYLLAMKLFASRIDADTADIALLYQHFGLTTVEEGLQIVQDAYPSRPIAVKTQYVFAAVVESLSQEEAGGPPRQEQAEPVGPAGAPPAPDRDFQARRRLGRRPGGREGRQL